MSVTDFSDPIIFGKDPTLSIVSIEPQDGHVELFIQQPDGSIKTEIRENKYWILCNEKPHKSWIRLEGEQYYKYGKQFDTREDFVKFRSIYKKQYDVFSIWDAKEATMVNKGLTYYKGLNPKDISILAFDIETNGVKLDENSKLYIIANTFRNSKGVVTRKLFSIDQFDNEGQMIVEWCKWIREVDPSIVAGHNIFRFDLPFLKHIADMNNIQLELGRDNSPLVFNKYPSFFRVDGSREEEFHNIKCYAREFLDTYFLSLKYDIATKKYESYGLKNIIKQEGLEDKDRQFYDAGKIKDNWDDLVEREKIKRYSINDGDDVIKLYDLMIAPFFYMANNIPKSFQQLILTATGSQINSMMIRSYLQDRYSIPKADSETEYQGAMSDGTPGIYKNVAKSDVNSLYPSLIIQFNVYDEQKDPNANFLYMVTKLTKQRLEHKKLAQETSNKYYKDLESSEKILINSFYGFLATGGLNFNSPSKASFVTMQGRIVLQNAIKWAKDKNFIISNLDTDAISFCKEDMSFISKEERKELLNNLNSLYPDKIKFSDDGYFSKFIVLAAKNYIMKDESGKVKLKGSSLKSSNLEPALKEFMNDIINYLLESDTIEDSKLVEIYNKYIKEIQDIKDIKRWSSKKTISDKVFKSERLNEKLILNAIEGTDYGEGDKPYFFYKSNESLSLVEHFNGDYNKDRLLEKVYKCTDRFSSILNRDIFVNYKLKRNKKLLEQLWT